MQSYAFLDYSRRIEVKRSKVSNEAGGKKRPNMKKPGRLQKLANSEKTDTA